MSIYKDIAVEILEKSGKPLHSDEITRLALEEPEFSTEGKTPNLTMYALLLTDINSGGENGSRFKKTGPSTFGLNTKYAESSKTKTGDTVGVVRELNVSRQQKGGIAEARVAELIILYGEKTLSCYKPISDDDGIDLIVKEKGGFKAMYIQVKSRFGDKPRNAFTVNVKSITLLDSPSMALVFCYFDIIKGDMSDDIWFVPASEFIKYATKGKNGILSVSLGGKRKSNELQKYSMGKEKLANTIIKQMGMLDDLANWTARK